MLNTLHIFSLSRQEGLPMVRIPCFAHAENLSVGGSVMESTGARLCDMQKIMSALPNYTRASFSDIWALRKERRFVLGNHPICYELLDASRWLLGDKEETKSLIALKRLDVAGLNETTVISMPLIKSTAVSSAS
jgi:hypothetical protein